VRPRSRTQFRLPPATGGLRLAGKIDITIPMARPPMTRVNQRQAFVDRASQANSDVTSLESHPNTARRSLNVNI